LRFASLSEDRVERRGYLRSWEGVRYAFCSGLASESQREHPVLEPKRDDGRDDQLALKAWGERGEQPAGRKVRDGEDGDVAEVRGFLVGPSFYLSS
jgi:hypothetical protein